MASRLIVLAAALVACQAAPVWFADNGFVPGTVFIREGRAPDFEEPSFAYGFGSGFTSKIGGISHSTGISTAFKSGQGQAYGAGYGGADGNAYGVGYANINPYPQPIYRTTYPINYSPYNGLRRNYDNNFGNAVSSAQNTGNYNRATSAAHNGGNYQSAVSSAQNQGLGYGSTVSSASSNGFGSAISSSDGRGNAISSAHSLGGNGFNAAVSASQNTPGFRGSTAQAVQQNGGVLQQSGASSIIAPGIEATQSHAIKTAAYY